MMKNAKKQFLIWIVEHFPMPGYSRQYIYKMIGVKLHYGFNEKKRIFIGENVKIDAIHPELIEIGNATTLATGCVILTHYIDTDVPAPKYEWKYGKVIIGKDCFIGANSIICKPVTIGDHSIIAAGSIVTKDVPPGSIWGGNPARGLKTRIFSEQREKEYTSWLNKKKSKKIFL